MKRRHEKPLRRVNPSGKIVWVARWTDRDGKRQSAGTYEMKREAQDAIDAAYDEHYNLSAGPAEQYTVERYAETWLRRHPRSAPTDRSYTHRLTAVLDIKLRDGRAFRHWRIADIRPRDISDIVDYMLREQKRAAAGAQAILAALSAMWRDAVHDDVAHYNPFQYVKVRANDPRILKAPRRMRVYSFEDMHRMADLAPGVYGPAMVRTLSDCGLRLGEMLALERADLRLDGCLDLECPARAVPHVHVHQTASDGVVSSGTKTTRGAAVPGRVAPVAPSLAAVLRALPPLTRLMFPTSRGRVLQNRAFYKDVWYPAREAGGLPDVTPHEFRHSWVTHMRAAGVDVADVAAAAGHTVETATAKYTHSLGQSFEGMIGAVE